MLVSTCCIIVAILAADPIAPRRVRAIPIGKWLRMLSNKLNPSPRGH